MNRPDRERFLDALLNSATDYGIISMDLDGLVTTWNEGARQLLGWTEAEIVGQPASVFFTLEDRRHGVPQAEMQAALTKGRGNDERWHQRKDGSKFWASGEMMPLKSEDGVVQGFIKILRDRTAHRKAEEDLRASKERLQNTLNNAQIVGTWDWDIANGCVYADERFARLFGIHPAKAAVGAPLEAFTAAVHPDDLQRLTAQVKAALNGAVLAAEYRVIQTDGSVRHVLARGGLVSDGDGEASRFAGVVVDITELRHVEETLRITQRAGGVGTFEFHPDTGMVDMSEEFRRIWGLQPHIISMPVSTLQPHIISMPVSTLQTLLLPHDGPQLMTGTVKDLDSHLGAVEYCIRRPSDGQVRWIARTSQEVNDDGKRRVLGIVQDVTERVLAQQALKASEAQFRTFAQAMPNHVWTSGPDGQADWFNQKVYNYTGAAEGMLDGALWLKVVHPEDIDRVTDLWARSLASGEQYEVEFRIRRADGIYRWHLVRAAAIRNDSGEIVRWIGANTDIEDQKLAARALSELNTTLETQVALRTSELMLAEEALRQSQKMEAVGQLTGGIAHDFNNLLTGITGALDLVRRRMAAGRTDDLDRFMDAAATSAQRAAALTHRLLAFARRQSLDTKPSAVNPLITGLEDLLRRTLGEHVELDCILDANLWPAMADANQLESALLNLAINARDAMPSGGKLTIETTNTHLDAAYARINDNVEVGDYVVISVSDTGVGMSANVIAKAFDPFFTTKPIGEGTGLGLSMIYGFVKQSGGHVRIYSEEGMGTTVKLFLRRADHDGQSSAREAEAKPPRGRGEMVLVVEDDATVRLLVTEVLGELGYRYMEAPDARTAIPLLESSQGIDLLITDVGLPVMNGRQLAEIARQHRPDLKILFVTGYAQNAAFRGDFLAPGMEMMTKPFALDALGTKIREMIER
jgi:PAS domain S-box-containing protein